MYSGIIVASEVPVAANWIANPSFELGDDGKPSDWVFFDEHQGSVGACDAGHAHSGSRGIGILVERGMAFGRWMTPYRIPLESNARYHVSFWYRGKGGSAYIIGEPTQLTPDGRLIVDLGKKFKTTIAKNLDSAEWTFVEGDFTAPAFDSWGQLCLSAQGESNCSFDDVTLVRPGLTLVEPSIPQVIPRGAMIRLVFFAPELTDSDETEVRWRITSEVAVLDSVKKNSSSGTWEIFLRAKAVGISDLIVEASLDGVRPLRLNRSRYLSIFDPAHSEAFAFGAISDTHFYRPGNNERNEKFAMLAETINAIDPLFVLSLGDQMEIHNGLRDEENKLICEAVKEQLGRLNAPTFTVAGNHEVDRVYEGVGSQWYYQKYLAQPQYWSFHIGPHLFAGIDVSTPGIAAREHGASFLDCNQSSWLEDLLSAPRRPGVAVLAAHISPFNEFSDTVDRDKLLSLILGKRVNLYLCGHTHYTEDVLVPNGSISKPWPNPKHVEDDRSVAASLQKDDATAILTTTTACAFTLGSRSETGWRYIFIKGGKVFWQGVLPSMLTVRRFTPSYGEVRFHITNQSDKPIFGLPLGATLPFGEIVAAVAGKTLNVEKVTLQNGNLFAWVQIDCPVGSDLEIIFSSQKR